MINVALQALLIVLAPSHLAILVAGVIFGLSLGIVPGLGGVVGLAMLIPFTYNLDPYSAFALLLGMAAVTTVSDLVPAILFGVPGSVGAAATVLDGHVLAKQGQAGHALGAGYTAALIGGLFGAVLLAVAMPVIRPLVLYFGSAELLGFCIFGLSMVAVLSGKAPLKGLAAVGLGLMLAMIGSGSQAGIQRWTFGTFYLWDRLPLIPVTLGLFAMPEIADLAISRSSIARVERPDFSLRAQWSGAKVALQHWWLILRCSAIGSGLGTVPGMGAASIDWIAYGHAIRTAKDKSQFGKGDIRGVIGPEASNNAKEGGQLIPTIAFGVPAGAGMAVLLGAFLMHGLVPGPEMLTKHLDVTYSMIWSLTLAHVIGAAICLCFSGLFARLATIKASRIVPIVLSVMFLSAFQGSVSSGDIYALVIFGVVGWLMSIFGWPRPPMMLGFVLGALFERYLYISTETYNGFGWLVRPVVIVVLAIAAWAMLGHLKTSLGTAVEAFRMLRKNARFKINPNAVFTILVLATAVAGLILSQDWPKEAKLVPYCAIYIVLICAGLNLIAEVLSSSASVGASAVGATPGADEHVAFGDTPRAVDVNRALRHLGWLVAFLAVSWMFGLLAAIVLLILMQSRIEFDESWTYSVGASALVGLLVWLVFDQIFALNWPPSFVGDQFPDLRALIRFV